MTKRIFYEKIGRRYRPVYEWDQGLMDAMPRGTHLVMCYPGGQSTRYNVDPNLAALIAAGRVAEDAMCNAVRKASERRSACGSDGGGPHGRGRARVVVGGVDAVLVADCAGAGIPGERRCGLRTIPRRRCGR